MSLFNPDVNAGRPRGARGAQLLPHLLPRLLLSLIATALTVHVWRQRRR